MHRAGCIATIVLACWLGPNGCYRGDGDPRQPSTADIDSDALDPPQLIDWDPSEWTPQGSWGADGDLGGGGGSGYKANAWECLICDEDSHVLDADLSQELLQAVAERPRPTTTPNMPPPDEEPTVLYLSADDSNSQSSPVLVRDMILSDQIVPAGAIRLWEFLNYYDIEYFPSGSQALSVTPQLRPFDLDEGIYALQLGLQGRVLIDMRRPINVALSIDTSGSMGGTPIELAKETCRAIAARLDEGDTVSVVSWSTGQSVLLEGHAVTGPDDPELLSVIDGLSAGGSTNLHDGLAYAYALALAAMIDDGMNRVVLISDGGANVGVVDADLIGEAAAGNEAEEIFLVGAGVGLPGGAYGYNDALMDTVTDLGKGASVFIDSEEEAHAMFENRFLSNMEMVAYDVMVELTLPPYFEMYEFLGEEYSEDPDEVEPQHLAPNDAMIYQQLIRTTQPESVVADYEIGVHVTWTDALGDYADEFDASWTLQELIDAPCDQLRKGDTIVVYGQTLGRVYQHLAEYEPASALYECEWGLGIVQESAFVLDDPELYDIAALLEYYCTNVIS